MDSLLTFIRLHLSDDTNCHLTVVFLGHIARLAIGLLSSALLARGLGPEGLSVFSVIGATIAIALTLSDFGLNTSAVSHIANGTGATSSTSGWRMAGSYAQLKVTASLSVVIALLLFAQPLAEALDLDHPSSTLLLRVASLGLLATALSSLVSTVLRALRRFRVLVLTQLANIGLTVLLLGTLFLTGHLTVLNALLVGAITALAATMLGFGLLPSPWKRALLARPVSLTQEARHLLSFSKWLALSAILSILLSQLDLLLLNHWMPAHTVGFYALALNLAFKADIINQTLHTVLLPQVSSISRKDAFLGYLRRSLSRSLLLALAVVALLPLAHPFILTVYGTGYAPSVGVFYALMSIILFDLLTIPILLLAFPLNIPHVIVAADVVGVIVLPLVAAITIPIWGLYGAVWAKLTAKVCSGVILGFAVILRLRAAPPAPVTLVQAPGAGAIPDPHSSETT
ncbi:MAG: oligosaccharide flippase family protein [Chloroflexota bacterium]|nr:oligosaccharide flippase family protein [Chloroflexota bacterium]